MKKIIFFLTVFILFTAAQAQSSNSDCDHGYSGHYGSYGYVEVCAEMENRSTINSVNECYSGSYNQYGVCIERAELTTPQGKVIVEPSSNQIIRNTSRDKEITIDVSTDKDRYYTNDRMYITVRLRGGGAYVYVYGIDSQNKVTRLFPNRYDQSHYVQEGTMNLPRSGYFYRVNGIPGSESIVVIASTNPNFNLENTTSYATSSSDYSTSGHISRFGTDLFKGIEVLTIEEQITLREWDTDTVRFTHISPSNR